MCPDGHLAPEQRRVIVAEEAGSWPVGTEASRRSARSPALCAAGSERALPWLAFGRPDSLSAQRGVDVASTSEAGS
jgi:hypothetical protein